MPSCDQKAKKGGVTVVFDEEKRIALQYNHKLLEQAMINLIDNAIKYSAQDSIIYVSLSVLSKDIEISVSDEGCGVEERHCTRLFERF